MHIDETMIHYKYKSHRRRTSISNIDALCIVEVDGNIKRVYAKVITDKKQKTIVPIILHQVL